MGADLPVRVGPCARYLLSPLVSSCKRVRQTINPALTQDGKPYMVFGTPGADTQPRGVAPRVTVT
jgi:gamma-glutamyltranspeptidase